MYNKIAPIILNAGKNAFFSDVYVAQPDSLKENLAGKIFILAEINAKKNEGRLIFNFLIEALENYYYNDEKILLKEKIEGLKLENIFEAALTKVNKDLNEFLINEKIKINIPASSITIGVVYESKLYFSGFGKNRALLIYYRNEQFEVINVETNASDIKEPLDDNIIAVPKELNLFSSVISGEIPLNSYFFFASEALPEYLSNKEMISVVTKLPPIVAAEQIKNTLEKINTYVPFLGVIIKNTAGLGMTEAKEDFEEILTTHNSISTLDHTEQKTEQILAPAGVISINKIIKKGKNIFGNWSTVTKPKMKKTYKTEDEKVSNLMPVDLGKVKSLNLARSDSFLLKEKIFFKKTPGEFFSKLKNIGQILVQLFNPRNWLALILKAKDWFKSLNSKNSLLFSGLVIVIVIFSASLIYSNISKKNQTKQNNYNNLVTQIESGEDSIETRLSYTDKNDESIPNDLKTIQSLLASLPREKTVQKNTYDRLNIKFLEISAKVQKIVSVTQIEKTNDLTGLTLNSIFLISGNIFGTDGKTIYNLTIGSSSSTKTDISGATDLTKPTQSSSDKNYLYYLNGNQILKFDLKKKSSSFIEISNSDQTANLNTFKVYGTNGSNLYALAKANNQIYKYSKNVTGFSTKINWLKEDIDLSQASDLFVIDGSVYVLKNSGEVLKLYSGKLSSETNIDKTVFKSSALLPATTTASKFFIGVKYIYIYDGASKRLAVLNKTNGTLLNQYEVSSLTAPRILVSTKRRNKRTS